MSNNKDHEIVDVFGDEWKRFRARLEQRFTKKADQNSDARCGSYEDKFFRRKPILGRCRLQGDSINVWDHWFPWW